MRYSAFDRELFACVAGIRHFRYRLEGRPFTIYTDHKPLTFALGKVSEPWTAMQSRQLSYVAEFTTVPLVSLCSTCQREKVKAVVNPQLVPMHKHYNTLCGIPTISKFC